MGRGGCGFRKSLIIINYKINIYIFKKFKIKIIINNNDIIINNIIFEIGLEMWIVSPYPLQTISRILKIAESKKIGDPVPISKIFPQVLNHEEIVISTINNK